MQNEETIYEHVLLIGMFDKDTKKQELSKEYYEDTCFEVLGDCTIEDGEVVKEPSIKVTRYSKENNVTKEAMELARLLNQESIVVNTRVSTAVFIGSNG